SFRSGQRPLGVHRLPKVRDVTKVPKVPVACRSDYLLEPLQPAGPATAGAVPPSPPLSRARGKIRWRSRGNAATSPPTLREPPFAERRLRTAAQGRSNFFETTAARVFAVWCGVRRCFAPPLSFFLFWDVDCPKQKTKSEKPKRQSKALPHST